MPEAPTLPANFLEPGLDGPLGRFKGAKPPSPAWFHRALAIEPERGFVEVDGARIETRVWGEVGKPGLLLCHGNSAHADWWSFVAPFFANDWRVAAFSWSGMGASDWRATYDMDIYSREAMAVAEHLGLFEAGPPVFVAHSFAAGPVMTAAAQWGERLRCAIIVDNGARTEEQPLYLRRRSRPNAVYPTVTAALARYRLPGDPPDNLFLLDYCGRIAIVPAPDGEGWTWAFDPFSAEKRGFDHIYSLGRIIPEARCPLSFIWGDRSHLVGPEVLANTRAAAPPGTRFLEIPDSSHYIMIDQPLALVAAIKGLLA